MFLSLCIWPQAVVAANVDLHVGMCAATSADHASDTSKGYSLLLPPKSLIGPAIYEAVFAAVKKPLSSKQVSDPRGAGTEGLTKRIFAKHGFRPSLAGAEYKLPEGCGECDFVFEDDSNILLVECKAKPLTRRAMTGGVAEAMLDFAGGLVASQAQSLRHERL